MAPTVKTYLDEIEQIAQARGIRLPDRAILLLWLGSELAELTSRAEFDWSYRHVDPAVSTITGTRAYALPSDFGDNFARNAGDSGDQWCCLIDDGTNETLADYLSPVQFRSKNLRGTGNGRPSEYTVMTTPSGAREIWLYPTPDANGSTGFYTVDGLYQPTEWTITERDGLPSIPGNNPVLKYALLRRIDPATYEPKYVDAYTDLMYRAAVNRRAQMVPVLGTGNYNENTLMSARR